MKMQLRLSIAQSEGGQDWNGEIIWLEVCNYHQITILED